jgi:MraZ protein
MDAKNRVTIPSEWLGDGEVFFLLPAAANLSVMPAPELARKAEELSEMLPAGAARQQALRKIYSSARQVEPDKQGRILLPDDLCKKVELSGEVVFAGVERRFEIWNAAKWSNAAQEEPAEEVRRALEAIGF